MRVLKEAAMRAAAWMTTPLPKVRRVPNLRMRIVTMGETRRAGNVSGVWGIGREVVTDGEGEAADKSKGNVARAVELAGIDVVGEEYGVGLGDC
jgi:hypothetical protein